MITVTTIGWANGHGSDFALMKGIEEIPHYWDGKAFVRSPGEVVTWPFNPAGRKAADTERIKIVGAELVAAVEVCEHPGFVPAA